METYFCKYCGARGFSVKLLTMGRCSKSPSKFHVVYSGSKKSKYTCRYCGQTAFSIQALTAGRCSKSPNGFHIPM